MTSVSQRTVASLAAASFVVALLAVAWFATTGCDAPAKPREIVLAVKGMTCGSCAQRIGLTLGAIAGVERATVRFSDKRARVRYRPDKVELAALLAAVDKLGYRATLVAP